MQTWRRSVPEAAQRWRHRLLIVLGACLACWQLHVHASSAILIWPLDPVLEATDPGVAIWVENRGKQIATMQLRVVAWTQVDGQDQHLPQTDIIGTPAIFRIEPGKRQLVRLTRTQVPAAGSEWAYRVLIDEIPGAVPASMQAPRAPATSAPSATAPSGNGLRFQLRYSIPLFSYGAGLMSPKKANAPPHPVQWRQGGDGKQRWVEIRNPGTVHAKLVGIDVRGEDGQPTEVANGHLGYVLAGSYGRWMLPDTTTSVRSVHAGINGSESRPLDPEMP